MKRGIIWKVGPYLIFMASFVITWMVFDFILNSIDELLFIKEEPARSYFSQLVLFIFKVAIYISITIKYKIWVGFLLYRDEFLQWSKNQLVFQGVLLGFSIAFIYSILSSLFFLVYFR